MDAASPLTFVAADLVAALLLSLVVASIAWTVTHEEIAREFRDWCQRRHRRARSMLARKTYYVFMCEYCFSHWVALVVLAATGFRLVYADWRGFVVAFFVIVWTANHSMSLYARIRLDIKNERLDIEAKEQSTEDE